MSTANFAYPVALPVWIDGEQKPFKVYADGLVYGESSYDGFTNKVVITPTCRAHPEWIHSQVPIGEDYRISERLLSQLIWESNPRR